MLGVVKNGGWGEPGLKGGRAAVSVLHKGIKVGIKAGILPDDFSGGDLAENPRFSR